MDIPVIIMVSEHVKCTYILLKLELSACVLECKSSECIYVYVSFVVHVYFTSAPLRSSLIWSISKKSRMAFEQCLIDNLVEKMLLADIHFDIPRYIHGTL